ncbi:hypothetical protein V1511DRAFT_495702 [Dipodascopsis uninucleata]
MGPKLEISKFERLGTLVDVNGHKYIRDIGCSSTLRGVPIWLFGDTFPHNAKGQMIGLITSTAAMGNPKEPTKSKYLDIDRDGRPVQFIPFTDEEQAFNKQNSSGGAKRYFLWSFSKIVEVEPGEGWIFFTKGRTQSQSLQDNVDFGVQIGRVHFTPDRKLSCERMMREPLFKDGCKWGSWEAFLDKGYIYLYGEHGGHVYLARVPPQCPMDKSQYEFWCKDHWSKDESKKSELFWKLQSGTVFWSRFHKCFLMIGCTMWADNKIVVRSAPRPEGPWTNDELLYQLYKPPSGFNYCVNAHPWAFPESSGGELLVSWTDQHTGVIELSKITWKGYQG